MGDGTGLETIQLIKLVFEGNKADEVEYVIVLRGCLALFIHHEGVLASERVMGDTDDLRVANRMTLLPRGETSSESA